MNEKEKQAYLEKYHEQKEHGVPFFPDIIFKDAVVMLLVFLILVALAYWVGAPLEARADPGDTTYTPRPEWYFLFLFQLLKYFPGSLEVIGVIGLPTLAILALFVLPFLDRSAYRHFLRRPVVTGITAFVLVGILFLTIQSVREAPPPAETASGGDATAALYTRNCAACHGASIQVAPGTNLHEIIAGGKHEGMPAWSADLTGDQIDALVGFILSPGGSELFTQNCAQCHEVTALVSSDPIKLKDALQQGKDFPPHQSVEIPDWSTALDAQAQTSLLNFLVAPDGQRLFSVYCSACHGSAVAFSGDETQLREIISKGGMHLEMPSWREKLSDADLQMLAQYVVDPSSAPQAQKIFQANCAICHGDRIPKADGVAQASRIIASGGSHQTMPIWGQILTTEQLDALVSYTLQAAQGTSLEVGQKLFNTNCTACHGQFGEGGPNPAHPGETITPISSSEFLKTRDDFTLQAIISQGQPNLGMSPFGTANGGPLSDEEIGAILAYIRSWEANPPVELPPQVEQETLALQGAEIYKDICAQCHGEKGEGGVGPSLSTPDFQTRNTDQDIFNIINLGHAGSPMIAWGDILSKQQIDQLVAFIRKLETAPPTGQTTPVATATPAVLSFKTDVLPIIESQCLVCHQGTSGAGGWDASNYNSIVTSGDSGPVVIPGDMENSLLAQKILGTTGIIMPPGGKLSDAQIQIILDWIKAGALDN
jgi:mono/diheme cytochrome c family protein